MQNIDLKTLIPAITYLIVFISTTYGKRIDDLTATQLAIAIVTLLGVIAGILADHKKQPPQPPQGKPPLKP